MSSFHSHESGEQPERWPEPFVGYDSPELFAAGPSPLLSDVSAQVHGLFHNGKPPPKEDASGYEMPEILDPQGPIRLPSESAVPPAMLSLFQRDNGLPVTAADVLPSLAEYQIALEQLRQQAWAADRDFILSLSQAGLSPLGQEWACKVLLDYYQHHRERMMIPPQPESPAHRRALLRNVLKLIECHTPTYAGIFIAREIHRYREGRLGSTEEFPAYESGEADVI